MATYTRSMTPAAQHRKALGDYHRKETTRVVSNLRRRSARVIAQEMLRETDAAIVRSHELSLYSKKQSIAAQRTLPRWLIVSALVASIAVLSYAFLVFTGTDGVA